MPDSVNWHMNGGTTVPDLDVPPNIWVTHKATPSDSFTTEAEQPDLIPRTTINPNKSEKISLPTSFLSNETVNALKAALHPNRTSLEVSVRLRCALEGLTLYRPAQIAAARGYEQLQQSEMEPIPFAVTGAPPKFNSLDEKRVKLLASIERTSPMAMVEHVVRSANDLSDVLVQHASLELQAHVLSELNAVLAPCGITLDDHRRAQRSAMDPAIAKIAASEYARGECAR